MPRVPTIDTQQLREIRDKLVEKHGQGNVKAWMVKDEIKMRTGTELDESTIRGKFIEIGEPLSQHKVNFRGDPDNSVPEADALEVLLKPTAVPKIYKNYQVPDDMKVHIPEAEMFGSYVERDIDRRLAIHYNIGKHPITQGKQGTGKTFSHHYYAFKSGLPFFLFSGYRDFKLQKLYGDKTIKNGSVMFQESVFVKATQCPSVILFDEINNNDETIDFHALLQNRQLYIKDANDGQGKTYHLHPECKIGFAQNPKSAKYIGGKILPSNFLGRCTFITYPEFTADDITSILRKQFPDMNKADRGSFSQYYFAVTETIDRSNLPVDVSIRQLISMVELWKAGISLKESIEDSLISMMDAASQPNAKESFLRLAQAVWKDLM
jgi:hypothetical protein